MRNKIRAAFEIESFIAANAVIQPYQRLLRLNDAVLVCGKQLEKLQADSDADIEEIKALKEKNYFHESAMQEAQAEIERLKCCGNCKHDSDGEERCYKRSKGFSMIHCVWEAKK